MARPTHHKPPMDRRRRMRLLLSYAPDWIITIGVTGLFYLLDRVQGFRRNFSLNDTTIQYPYAVHERVPTYLLVILSLVAPLVIMPVVNLVSVRSLWDWHNSSLGLILSWGLTGTLTNIVKITVGRPRPDVIDRCQPFPGSQNAPVYGLVDSSICSQTDQALMKDGWRSFFSGHSSLSFAGLGFLFFYNAGKLHLYDHRGQAGKSWLAFVPLVAASLVAISRTMDYRHHPGDVLVGSLVGIVIAHFCYRQYYPPLDSPLSHHPYSPRVRPDEETVNPSHVGPTPAAAGEAYGGGSTMSGSQLNDDRTVQRANPDLSKEWGVARSQEGAETVARPDAVQSHA